VCYASTADGACILQFTDDGDPDQRWQLVYAGGGYSYVINRNSSKALWQITSVGGGWYTITNRTSGKVGRPRRERRRHHGHPPVDVFREQPESAVQVRAVRMS